MTAAPQHALDMQCRVSSESQLSGNVDAVRGAGPAALGDRGQRPGPAFIDGEAGNRGMTGRCLPPSARAAAPGKSRAWERSYAGLPDQAARVRDSLAGVLGDCPVAADAILLTNELVSNAILHSDSRQPGGEFSVRAEIHDGKSVRVEVADAGGQWARHGDDSGRPGGRGLIIVQALASAWGVTGDDKGRTVWFVTGWNAGGACPAMHEYRSPEAPCRPIRATSRPLFQRMQAFEDAIAYRRARATLPCPDCNAVAPDQRCDDHARDLELIAEYLETLQRSVLSPGPAPAGNGRQ